MSLGELRFKEIEHKKSGIEVVLSSGGAVVVLANVASLAGRFAPEFSVQSEVRPGTRRLVNPGCRSNSMFLFMPLSKQQEPQVYRRAGI